MRPAASPPPRTRRPQWLGVHSIAEFHLSVPDLAEAQRFYSVFGLRTAQVDQGLHLTVAHDDHVWGRIARGDAPSLSALVFHCFADDLPALRERAARAGAIDERPGNGEGFWVRDADGLAVWVRPGAKTTLDDVTRVEPAADVPGHRRAPTNSSAQPALPRRLSHIALFTPDVPAQIDFYRRVMGLRLSDRSGDGIAFLHGPHGSDHHLIALLQAPRTGLHHLSWDVPSIDDVGLGMMRLHQAGYVHGWGVGRHVLGSNYFYYARDPWGSFCELSAGMDHIPADVDWVAQDHPPQDSFYLWGPEPPPVVTDPPPPGTGPSHPTQETA